MSKDLVLAHEGNALHRDIIAMTLPLFLMSFFFYGPRVLLLALVAVITARLCDRAAAMLRSRRYDRSENSSVATALIIVLLVPATVQYRVVVAAVMVAVLVGKEAFGGYKSYPFNPAAVGFCVAAVSWPQQMLRYPNPQNWPLYQPMSWEQLLKVWRFEDVTLVEGPSYVLRNGAFPNIDNWQLLLGDYAGPLGVTSTIVIASCAVYLLVRHRLPPAAPLSFLITVTFIAFFFPRYSDVSWQTWPYDVLLRLTAVKYEVLSGAMLFAALFLVDEVGTLPNDTRSRAVYGVMLGIAAMMFRYFGTFELGTCFGFLLVNALSGYIDRVFIRRDRLKQRKEAAR